MDETSPFARTPIPFPTGRPASQDPTTAAWDAPPPEAPPAVNPAAAPVYPAVLLGYIGGERPLDLVEPVPVVRQTVTCTTGRRFEATYEYVRTVDTERGRTFVYELATVRPVPPIPVAPANERQTS